MHSLAVKMDPRDYGLARESFILDVEIDCKIFAGRDDVKKKLEGRIRRGLITNTSIHTFIYGDYGSGKTHTLHFFHNYVSEQHGIDILPIFVPQPQVDARSTPSDLFQAIITAISPVEIFELFTTIWDEHQSELQERTELSNRVKVLQKSVKNRDLAYVIHKYYISRPQEDYAVIKWLSGQKCTSKEKESLQVISDNSDPNIAIRTLISIFQLFNKYKGKYILLLLDELETLSVLNNRKMTEFETFFRQLVSEQQGIATVMAQSAEQSIEDGIRIFFPTSPVGTRIGYPQNYIWLKPFEDSVQIKDFWKDLTKLLRPKDMTKQELSVLIEKAKDKTDETLNPDCFPFTEEAFELMAQSQLEQLPRGLFPRDIEKCATQCLGEAMSKDKGIITTEEVSVVMEV